MMAEPARTASQRKADTLVILGTPHADVWVSTASAEGVAHLVPLSYAWLNDRVVLAAERPAVTARNILDGRHVRLGFGRTRDVVMIDAALESSTAAAAAPIALADAYAAQADWDPRHAGDSMVFLVLRPQRVQAWREANEISGRTLMRNGEWMV